MKRRYLLIPIAIFGIVYSCATNPFTGKSTLALVPDSQILPSAFQQYSAFLKENKVVTGTADNPINKISQSKLAYKIFEKQKLFRY